MSQWIFYRTARLLQVKNYHQSWREKLNPFSLKLRDRYHYSPQLILSMDEIPVFMDMVPGQTIAIKGTKEDCVQSTGERERGSL